jgi:hypothetical protein
MTTTGTGRTRGEKHWTEAEARAVLEAWAKSGLSMRAFANREGLEPRRLYRWNARLGIVAEARGTRARRTKRAAVRRRAESEPAARFVPVVVKETRAAIVIRHGGSTVEFDPEAGVSPVWVAAVMLELGRATCS